MYVRERVPAVFSALALFHERRGERSTLAQLGAFSFRLNRDIIVPVRRTRFMGPLHPLRAATVTVSFNKRRNKEVVIGVY